MAEMQALATLKQSLPDLCALMKLNAQDGVDIQTMALQELDHLNAHAMMNQNLLAAAKALNLEITDAGWASAMIY